jgi:16S rRNA (uracil1498-N3)-methyltransferase
MGLRLFIHTALRAGEQLQLSSAAARHVQVRRLQPGDALRLFDGSGGEWPARVLHMGRADVSVQLGQHPDPVDRELPLAVTLALGMPANERMDLLVEKATELGAHTIQPLLCERSVLRLAADRAARKREHWQGIAVAAAEQCGRTRVPHIAAVLTLPRWLSALPDAVARLLLSPQPEATPLALLDWPQASVLCLSGPEGGLSAQEQRLACDHGFVPVRLGPRVLRAETAPLAALAWMGINAG